MRRVLSRVAAGVAATAVVSLALPAAPASAHGQLATSTPLTGTVVREPLTQLALYFTEKPAPNAHFTITGPNGSRVDNGWSFGEPKRLDKPVTEYFMVNGVFEPRLYHTGFPAMVTVAHWPAKGRYTASYLSVASDGEAVRGEVTFDYQGRGTAAPAGWSAPTNGPEPALLALAEGDHSAATAAPATTGAPVAGPPAPPADDGLPPWLLPAGVVLVVGAIVVVAARRKPASARSTGAARRPAGTARRPGDAARRPGDATGRKGVTSRNPARRGRR
ncbi:copper resistance protein CopC [Micromonospora sp. NPDC093244]|uniref:copper resistance protein CopC n=1 Tax=Micromonospora sp. NPDC093244 TaxID=3155071 RepID=UPI003423634F